MIQQEKINTFSESNIIKSIPIISWKKLDNWIEAIKIANKKIVTIGNLSKKSFALVLPDSSMEPFFPRGTLLIFDPEETPKDRSYILVKLEENDLFIFRQLIIDGDDHYLKPLNPDLSMFKMRFLDNKDKILACLVESRNKFLPEDQLRLLEDI